MKKPIIIFLLIVSFLILSCCSDKLNPELTYAESIIESKPDSSLVVLYKIDLTKLKSEKDKAYYSLLFTQALFKNNYNITTDSLISQAVEYFSKHKNDSNLMKSLFYKGQTLFYSSELDKATECGMKSRDLAIKLENYYWHAKSSEMISDILSKSHLYKEALNMSIEAAVYYQKAGEIRNHRFSLADVALDYSNVENRLRAREILDSVISIAEKEKDNILKFYCYRNLYRVLDRLGEREKAFKIVNDLKNSENPIFYNGNEKNFLIKYLISQKDYIGAETALKAFRNEATSNVDLILVYCRYSSLYREINNSKKALEYSDSAHNLQDEDVLRIIDQSPIGVQKQFYSNLAEERNRDNQSLTYYIILISLGSIILIACGIIVYVWRMRRKDAVINEKVRQLLSLSRELQKRTGYDSETGKTELETLYKGKWELSNMILDEYLKGSDDNTLNDRFMHRINEFISKIKAEDNIKLIEKSVDNYMGNSISLLRENCPSLNESDIQFVTLLLSGFSRNAICLLLGFKIKSFYTRKNRIIEKIRRFEFLEREGIIHSINE